MKTISNPNIDHNSNPSLIANLKIIKEDYTITTQLRDWLVSRSNIEHDNEPNFEENNFSGQLLNYLHIYIIELELFLVAKDLNTNHYQFTHNLLEYDNQMHFDTLGHIFTDNKLLKGYNMIRTNNFIFGVFTILEICIDNIYKSLKIDDDIKYKKYNDIKNHITSLVLDETPKIREKLKNNHISFADKISIIKQISRLRSKKTLKEKLKVFTFFGHLRNVTHNNGRYGNKIEYSYKTDKVDIIIKPSEFVGLKSSEIYHIIYDTITTYELLLQKMHSNNIDITNF